MEWQVRPLTKEMDRTSFDCGDLRLNKYIKEVASQNARRDLGQTYVLIHKDSPGTVVGYYTLATASLVHAALPEEVAKGLPKYDTLPAVLLARLAIDKGHKGQRLGEFLLVDAFRNALEISTIAGAFALVVDVKNKDAKAFYVKYDFESFLDSLDRLFVPMNKIRKALSGPRFHS